MTEQNKQSDTPAPEAHVDAGGYRKGVKDAVTFLHEQAALSKSSTIKTVLDSMANAIGNKFKPIPSTGTNMVGWQGINTAPIGKSVILCTWWKHSPSSAFRAEGYMDRDTKTWRNQDGSPISEDRTQPTHWMDIPSAPVTTTEGPDND